MPCLVAVRGVVGLSCRSLNLARKSSPCFGLQIASHSFHHTTIRWISQASKDKVNERNEVIKKGQTLEVRLKKIIVEQLDVKESEVSEFHLLTSAAWTDNSR
jgi:hypothetical protein